LTQHIRGKSEKKIVVMEDARRTPSTGGVAAKDNHMAQLVLTIDKNSIHSPSRLRRPSRELTRWLEQYR